MRVLVTGGAGYIGSVVTDHLLRAGHTVTVLDNLIMGWREAVPAAAEFVHADTGDEAALDVLFDSHSFEAVLHFAALIEAGESVKVPEQYFDNNSLRTLTLLRAMLRYQVMRFVFSSTAAVYGEPQIVPIPEDHPLAPTNAYGESKLIVEQMLAWFHRAHGFRYASLRYFNAAGADPDGEIGELHEPETHLVPLVLQTALGQRSHIDVYGTDYPTPDGTAVRDYIHVSDLARAHSAALNYLRRGGTSVTLNCGYGHGSSVLEVLDAVRRASGRNFRIEMTSRRPGDPACLVAEVERIFATLDWRPKFDNLDLIVAHAYAWEKKLLTDRR